MRENYNKLYRAPPYEVRDNSTNNNKRKERK